VILLAAPPILTVFRPLERRLGGTERPAPFPEARLNSWFEGNFQTDFEKWLQQVYYLRKPLVRTANQIDFSLFSEIPFKESHQIILGKENTLYQAPYIDAHFGRDVLPESQLAEFAAGLGRLQNHLEGHGVRFLFFITPSKASIEPDFIPDHLTVRSKGPARTNYEMLRPLLDRHGVHTLDGHALTASLKKVSGYPVFPKGGVHWNHYASFRVTQELVTKLEALLGRKMINLKLEGVTWERRSTGSDVDLARLANLWRPSVFYTSNPYPKVLREIPPEAVRPSVLLVGGSFLDLPVHWLRENGVLREDTDYDFYLKKNKGRIEDLRREVLTRDAVILETNEAAIGFRGHGLIEALAPAGDPRPR
jgi:hypothetical protein